MIDNDKLRWLILQLWAHDEIYKTDMTTKRDDECLYECMNWLESALNMGCRTWYIYIYIYVNEWNGCMIEVVDHICLWMSLKLIHDWEWN